MHALHLAEMAAVFAQNATAQLKLGSFPSRELSNSYWLATRFRHEEWSGRLARHRIEIQSPGAAHRLNCWNAVNPLMQEILLAEPLTRAITYFSRLAEKTKTTSIIPEGDASAFAALAQTAFASHTEARNRCLHLIVFGQGLPADQATRLNRLRQQMELFNDHVLGFLPQNAAVEEFAFNPLDVAQVHESIHSDGEVAECRRWHLIKLRQQIWHNNEDTIDRRASSARLNSRLANVILKAFSPTMFDGFGVPISAELARMKVPPAEDVLHADPSDSVLHNLLNPKGIRQNEPAPAKRW